MRHAPIKPDDEAKWPAPRLRRYKTSHLALAEIVRLDPPPGPGAGSGKAQSAVPKDRRRPGMY